MNEVEREKIEGLGEPWAHQSLRRVKGFVVVEREDHQLALLGLLREPLCSSWQEQHTGYRERGE